MPVDFIRDFINNETPQNISNILYRSISCLDEDVRHVADVCSILGMRIDLNILLAVLPIERIQVLKSLELLEKKGVINKYRIFPSAEWVFTHELLQKVIYNQTESRDRIQWHLKIIQQLKKPAFKRLPYRYQMISFHAQRTNRSLLKALRAHAVFK